MNTRSILPLSHSPHGAAKHLQNGADTLHECAQSYGWTLTGSALKAITALSCMLASSFEFLKDADSMLSHPPAHLQLLTPLSILIPPDQYVLHSLPPSDIQRNESDQYFLHSPPLSDIQGNKNSSDSARDTGQLLGKEQTSRDYLQDRRAVPPRVERLRSGRAHPMSRKGLRPLFELNDGWIAQLDETTRDSLEEDLKRSMETTRDSLEEDLKRSSGKSSRNRQDIHHSSSVSLRDLHEDECEMTSSRSTSPEPIGTRELPSEQALQSKWMLNREQNEFRTSRQFEKANRNDTSAERPGSIQHDEFGFPSWWYDYTKEPPHLPKFFVDDLRRYPPERQSSRSLQYNQILQPEFPNRETKAESSRPGKAPSRVHPEDSFVQNTKNIGLQNRIDNDILRTRTLLRNLNALENEPSKQPGIKSDHENKPPLHKTNSLDALLGTRFYGNVRWYNVHNGRGLASFKHNGLEHHAYI